MVISKYCFANISTTSECKQNYVTFGELKISFCYQAFDLLIYICKSKLPLIEITVSRNGKTNELEASQIGSFYALGVR